MLTLEVILLPNTAIDLIQYATKTEGERTKLLTKLLYFQFVCFEKSYAAVQELPRNVVVDFFLVMTVSSFMSNLWIYNSETRRSVNNMILYYDH
jgi:hypothetical protein